MDYRKVLKSTRKASKDDLKKVAFELDNDHIKKIKDMKLDKSLEETLIKMSKNRAFFEMLLINALK